MASVGVGETSVVTEELPLTLGLLPILEEYWAWTRMRRILYYIIYHNTYSVWRKISIWKINFNVIIQKSKLRRNRQDEIIFLLTLG